ncbi:hypothetical protein I302_108075 [Kwoniella bestiolae CBS 10118]|uniref:Uncharacterized protein n=1 Tax=Kwoniella bestiolae CBS 10118 TaxID=1296100 RepID=A0A1B9FWQ2_9TREE|nr:hypothetical protein I302_07559 [Kwoniella bestiolae CBS 10118]OCF23205.1 hypothetical protein I302_07559 [Kwoniella bestiolae CBS 10118]
MGSITTTGFCSVTGRYAAYGILCSPGTWGSTGACAWCDATTQTVYTNPSNPSYYTFQCDPSGSDNSMACTLFSLCSQAGPGYYPAPASSIQTPDYGECSTVKYVTSIILLEPGGAAMYTPRVTIQPYEMTISLPTATTTRAQVIGGPCARPYDRPASCGGVD